MGVAVEANVGSEAGVLLASAQAAVSMVSRAKRKMVISRLGVGTVVCPLYGWAVRARRGRMGGPWVCGAVGLWCAGKKVRLSVTAFRLGVCCGPVRCWV